MSVTSGDCSGLRPLYSITKNHQSTHLVFTCFTTRTPAVTDVLRSGRNVGALRPGRRVGFRSLVPGLADDICWGTHYF